MKTIAAGLTMLIAAMSVSGAQAADLGARPAAPPAPVSFLWAGPYLGIHAGGVFGNSRHDEIVAPLATTGDFDVSGVLIGATAGYNFQSGPWVYGLEGDIGWTSSEGSATCPNVGFTCKTEGGYRATLRGRFGYAYDRALIFVTGGGALAGIEQSFSPPFGGVSGKTFDRFGFAVGAGIEYALTANLSAKLEYLYTRYSDTNCGYACTGVAGQALKIKLDENIVRVGLNYQFSGF